MTLTAAAAPPRAVRDISLPTDEAVLIVTGKDRPGIVASISGLLSAHGANIVSLDQYSDDPQGGRFFQRTVFRLDNFVVRREPLQADLAATLQKGFDLDWKLTDRSVPKRVVIMASKSDHCLIDLLWRQRRGEIPMVVSMVISNHVDMADDVRSFGVPFFYIPSQPGSDKSESERRIIELVQGNADLVVLARYMQILSAGFLEEIAAPVINIHHSFLPAFIGAAPYRKAKERGVKLIGATAHYVTRDLDEGPIIEQDVVRVTHGDSTMDLQRRGADVERHVLSRAVAWHCDDRVIRHGNHTIVF